MEVTQSVTHSFREINLILNIFYVYDLIKPKIYNIADFLNIIYNLKGHKMSQNVTSNFYSTLKMLKGSFNNEYLSKIDPKCQFLTLLITYLDKKINIIIKDTPQITLEVTH